MSKCVEICAVENMEGEDMVERAQGEGMEGGVKGGAWLASQAAPYLHCWMYCNICTSPHIQHFR